MSSHAAARRPPANAWHFDGFEALDNCHRETLRTLQLLDELIRRLDEHGDDATTRRMAGQVDRHFSVTMREHHEDEERHVFPILEAEGDSAARHVVDCLRQDHCWLHTDWRELSPLVSAVAHGQTGVDIEALREGAGVFGLLCHDHIALEESLIYPQAFARMDDETRRAMNLEMSTRRRLAPAPAASA